MTWPTYPQSTEFKEQLEMYRFRHMWNRSCGSTGSVTDSVDPQTLVTDSVDPQSSKNNYKSIDSYVCWLLALDKQYLSLLAWWKVQWNRHQHVRDRQSKSVQNIFCTIIPLSTVLLFHETSGQWKLLLLIMIYYFPTGSPHLSIP